MIIPILAIGIVIGMAAILMTQGWVRASRDPVEIAAREQAKLYRRRVADYMVLGFTQEEADRRVREERRADAHDAMRQLTEAGL